MGRIDKDSQLSFRQLKFVEEYLVDGCGKRAAIDAGFSPKTAAVMASQMLKLPKIQDALDIRRLSMSQCLNITKESVATKLMQMINECETEKTKDRVTILKALDMLNKMFGFYNHKTDEGDIDTIDTTFEIEIV